MRPKFWYKLSKDAVAHASDRRCLTIQTRDPLFSEANQRPDRTVFLEPGELRKLRDALDDYLAEAPATTNADE
jgi:hypothetical protein